MLWAQGTENQRQRRESDRSVYEKSSVDHFIARHGTTTIKEKVAISEDPPGDQICEEISPKSEVCNKPLPRCRGITDSRMREAPPHNYI